MLKKYVVELDDENVTSAMGYDWLRIPISVEDKVVDVETTIQLLPYISPNFDIEQVKREAYREGREDGVHDGMHDAWEAARKIIMVNWGERHEMFGPVTILENIFLDNTAADAIKKIKEWEEKRSRSRKNFRMLTSMRSGAAAKLSISSKTGSQKLALTFLRLPLCSRR